MSQITSTGGGGDEPGQPVSVELGTDESVTVPSGKFWDVTVFVLSDDTTTSRLYLDYSDRRIQFRATSSAGTFSERVRVPENAEIYAQDVASVSAPHVVMGREYDK